MTELSECCLLLMDGCSFVVFVSQDQLVTLSLIIAVINFPPEIKHTNHVLGSFTEPGGTITVTGLI